MNTQNIIKKITTGIIFLMTVQFTQAENTKPTQSNNTNEPAVASENELGLESWMVETSFWKNEESKEMNLEDWMSDTKFWKSDPYAESNEEVLHVEKWMIDRTLWDNVTTKNSEEE